MIVDDITDRKDIKEHNENLWKVLQSPKGQVETKSTEVPIPAKEGKLR